MADTVPPEIRSRMMAGIRGKDTRPEMLLRRALHARGFRFRLHDRSLPGTPDLVLRKWNAVIFIHGCFWHGHECKDFRWPATRTDFWMQKISRNMENDKRHLQQLSALRWRICTVWECALKPKARREAVFNTVAEWLRSPETELELGEVRSRPDPDGTLA